MAYVDLETQLREVGTFEFYPVSEAFHEMMMHHSHSRLTTYSNVAPLFVTNVSVPEELNLAKSNSTQRIDNLSFRATQDGYLFQGNCSMTINNYPVEFEFDDQHSTVMWPSAETKSETIMPIEKLAAFLLSTLVEVANYDDDELSDILSSSPSTPDLLRNTICQLATVNGKFSMLTRATFESKDHAAIVDLIENETPTTNAVVVNVDLAVLNDKSQPTEMDSRISAQLLEHDDMDVTDEHAIVTFTDVPSPSDFVLMKFLELYEQGEHEVIYPENSFDRWAEVCRTVNHVLKPYLKPFLPLDTFAVREVSYDFTQGTFEKDFPGYFE